MAPLQFLLRVPVPRAQEGMGTVRQHWDYKTMCYSGDKFKALRKTTGWQVNFTKDIKDGFREEMICHKENLAIVHVKKLGKEMHQK